MENDFLAEAISIIEKNISDEQFGVSELARAMGISRSNLLRKVKKVKGVSVSQFMREIRLQHAMELLKDQSANVSEISYQVGFSSVSYFIKCFREYYGYPPGQVGSSDSPQVPNPNQEKQNPAHKLAAIMFTDIEGYTAIMQRDEKKALELIKRHREVFKDITKKYHGRILQYYGDGTLSTFTSAIDATYCAVEMQRAFRTEPAIPVRIGIHSGDILFNPNGIVGDGVNVASRIESLALPGSVFISDKVYDEVKNQTAIGTQSLGTFELKNVSKPLEIHAITNPGLVVPDEAQIRGKTNLSKPISGNLFAGRHVGRLVGWMVIPLALMIFGFLVYNSGVLDRFAEPIPDTKLEEKSIAVLPFINDSEDSTNVYIINGLMEAILNNLQKIKDLSVVSRTSVEQYRNTSMLIPEIAEELKVTYFVEGSGQKLGNKILLSIQLIDAENDRHLWSEQYNKEVQDIFELQLEVAKEIAGQIEVIITPQEEERLNKQPTDDVIAYDVFLKGQEYLFAGTTEGLKKSIPYFKRAIDQDNEFAHAYADVAIAYYLLDAMLEEKQFLDSINTYADQALLLDPQLPQSLVAKALYYINNQEYDLALPFLETALEYHPNSAMVLNILSDYYTSMVPNTEKYLEYALRGHRLHIGVEDSVEASFTNLHISNALIQNGFVKEAEKYINKSLSLDPNNLYAEYLKAYILFAGDRNLRILKDQLYQAWQKDTTRLDILQELAKTYYFMRDYKNALTFYQKFLSIKEALKLNIYEAEYAKIAMVFSKNSLDSQAQQSIEAYKKFAEGDRSIYRHLSLAGYHLLNNDNDQAMHELRLFSREEHYHYWTIIFLEMDPLFEQIAHLEAFKNILARLKERFWNRHERLEKNLMESGVI